MRRLPLTLVPLLAVSLGACAGKPMRTGGPLPPTLQACQADRAQSAIGAAATPERVERIRQQTHSRIVRVLRPGQMVTMEFNGARVDVRVDAQNIIVAVVCG